MDGILIFEMVKDQTFFKAIQQFIPQPVITVFGLRLNIAINGYDKVILPGFEFPRTDKVKEDNQLFLLISLETVGENFKAAHLVAGKRLNYMFEGIQIRLE